MHFFEGLGASSIELGTALLRVRQVSLEGEDALL